MTDIAPRLASYLAHRMPDARDLSVAEVMRIHGGASRETYRFRARWKRGGIDVEQSFILRRDPTSSLIETERRVEFAAFRAFHGRDVPVPEALFCENDARWLDRPFFVMEEVTGCQSSATMLALPPYVEHRERIGEQKWRILGRIARDRRAPGELEALVERPAPDDCWRRELSQWEDVLDQDELGPQPVVRAAIRRLRRRPPPPAQAIVVVHGDYRTGNFLYDERGDVRAILDWEMCHLGDPLEDLAWALTPLWGWPDASRPGKLIERERAIRLWEEESGFTVDPQALSWWETFACVKGIAIWTSSAREFADGRNRDPVMVAAAWYATDVHNRVLVDRLAPTSAEAS
jgi:aminoglycoside phosphotransferase (APT) family kinase protein